MKSLARIPFWLWLIILTLFCYGLWNPIQGGKFSLVGLMMSDAAMSVKALCGLLAGTVLALFFNATHRALGNTGLIIYAALIGALLWVLKDLGIDVKNPGFWSWAGPFFFALLLAIGSQGSKIYRAVTGRVSVEDHDTVHPDQSDDHDQE